MRYDNRDVGQSTHLDDARTVDLARLASGGSPPPYTLSDLARDAVGLVEALGLGSAHVVGMSLGGMIAQTMAIEHPDRVGSLTSYASTTGDRAVGASRPDALAALFAPAGTTREQVVERAVDVSAVIGSPGFERDEAWLRQRTGLAFDRGYDPAGLTRAGGDGLHGQGPHAAARRRARPHPRRPRRQRPARGRQRRQSDRRGGPGRSCSSSWTGSATTCRPASGPGWRTRSRPRSAAASSPWT